MIELCHFARLMGRLALRWGKRGALSYKEPRAGRWLTMDWETLSRRVDETARGWLSLEVRVQENIGYWGGNRKESLLCDFGAYSVRAAMVPIYATSSGVQVQFIVDNARIRLLVVAAQEQYDVAFRLLPLCPTLERLIIVDKDVVRSAGDNISLFFDDLLLMGQAEAYETEVERRRVEAAPDDIASILYTSGTTGEPKGVVITHGMFLAAMRLNDPILPLTQEDFVLNFLPFCHVLERTWSYFALCHGTLQAINEDPNAVLQSLKEVRPTCMCLVPRFWEKVYEKALQRYSRMSPPLKMFVRRAIIITKNYHIDYLSRGLEPPRALKAKYAMLDRMFLRSLRKGLGLDRAHFFPTAGAAIDRDVEMFVHCIGINIVCGYGLTETTATVACDRPGKPYSLGSVGPTLPGLEWKLSAEGEVLVRGETVTKGYYRNPQATAEAIDAEGWFHTGDAAYMKGSEMFLTDRIKNLYKTSNGKYIAPALIESRLTLDKYIDQIVVVADRRKFVSALIVPNADLLCQWARRHRLGSLSLAQLCQNERVYAFLDDRIQTLQQTLAAYERVKRFTLLPNPFSAEAGEITATLKLRRNVIIRNHKEQIDEMYRDKTDYGPTKLS